MQNFESMYDPSPWAVGIVVPAHNEEKLIERCLESLLKVVHNGLVWIVVVADTCSDNTASIAESVLRDRGEVVRVTERNAGASRAHGTEVVLRYFAKFNHDHRIWLANTDADSFVPTSWITDQLSFANAGYDAIAGVVEIDSFSEFAGQARIVKQRFGRSYGMATSGIHPHVQAANFGISARAYELVGGWPPIALGEDRELWNRLGDNGFDRIAERSVRVITSGRPIGRAPGGFAHSLQLLAIDPLTVLL